MKAGVLIAFFPVFPIALLVLDLLREVRQHLFGQSGQEWYENSPGQVFFVKPDSFASSFFWQLYLTQSMYAFNFLMLGTNPTAISHTGRDTILTKEFWRRHLQSSGVSVPKELASWDGKDKVEFSNDTTHKPKAIIKVNDSYLGLGDQIVKEFSLGSQEGKQRIEGIFKNEY